MANEKDREMGFDEEIDPTTVKDPDFSPLPDGEYPFTVTSFKRERFAGSAKMIACNKAALELTVITEDGRERTVRASLFLCESQMWKMLQFFTAIGQRKHGDNGKFVPNWNSVPGATGRCKIKTRSYTGKDGAAKTANEVDKWLEPRVDGEDDSVPF